MTGIFRQVSAKQHIRRWKIPPILIFPVFGLHTTLSQNLKLGAVFTLVSIARSYVLRRLFERLRKGQL